MGANLLNKLNYILDIGSSKLTLLAISRFAGSVRIVTKENILYDGYMDGEFLSLDDLTDTISQLFNKMSNKLRKKITKVIVGVPSEFCKCVCKRISRSFVDFHKITQTDVLDLYNVNSDFGDSEEYSVINYSPMQFLLDDNMNTLSPVGKRTSALSLDASYILARKSFLKTLTNSLNAVGVTDIEFISTALGQAMVCAKQNEVTRPIAVVDVGHISTSICVYKGEGLAFLSTLPVGGGHISSDIMQILGMSFKDSELIKRKVILTIETDKNEYYEICSKGNLIKAPINITNQIVKSRIESIARSIGDMLSIDDVFKDIDIYLTGDGLSNFKGVKNIFKDVTGLNVYEFKNQFDNSSDKFQTSQTGLVALSQVVI